MGIIFTGLIVLGVIGIVAATVLYVVSKRFYVAEDPRIAEVEALLPGANCGGCGRSGCHDFATACCTAETLDGLVCPGAGAENMAKIAKIVGLASADEVDNVAVLKCNGTCDVRPRRAVYEGAESCAAAALLGAGTGGCAAGCLGMGDCVAVCPFDAMSIDAATGLPVINDKKCTGCGVCVKACPRMVLELRPRGRRGLRVWVACNNHEKGAAAMRECKAACIACGKCEKACTHDAVTISGNLSYIDPEKCRLCRKCVDQCPTHAILTANFPVKKPEPASSES